MAPRIIRRIVAAISHTVAISVAVRPVRHAIAIAVILEATFKAIRDAIAVAVPIETIGDAIAISIAAKPNSTRTWRNSTATPAPHACC